MPSSSRPLPLPAGSAMWDRTALRILSCSQRLYGQHGLDTTVEQIADAAGVTADEVRSRFPTDSALLTSALSLASRGAGERVYEARPDRGWEALRSVVYGIEALNSVPGFFLFCVDMLIGGIEKNHPAHDWATLRFEFIDGFARHAVATGIEDGEMDPSIDADTVVRQMMGVFPAGLVSRVLKDDQAPVTIARELLELIEAKYRVTPAAD